MVNPKICEEEINGKKFKIYYFDAPLYHDDWHVAEGLGLEYVRYIHDGPDYWDAVAAFVEKGDKELYEEWRKKYDW